MVKIVDQAIKIDLHIHSKKSYFKDKNFVINSTIDNVQVLVEKLLDNKVNLFSITDHDSFDYDLYNELKKQESLNNCIKKILPGVEFTVTFVRNKIVKPLHVIAIFDDEDDDKVKNIEKVLKFNQNNKPNYDCNESFSEEKFVSILSEINIDSLLIVHQKQTISSGSDPKNNDANSLGEDAFNEFVTSEYFEAFEFKNKKNEVFNNLEKQKYENDSLRFITGSDCHEWLVYPKHDSTSKDVEFKHTYIKSLPTFRGLVFALTDDSRISLVDNFYSDEKNNYLDEIQIEINNEKCVIPLSKGINAIIGDNSIGKSLLFHKITDYYRQSSEASSSSLNNQIIKGYDKYLEENNILIETKLPQNMIFGFDTQGEIRKKFNQGKLDSKKFFANKYPLNVDVTEIKENVLKIVEDVIVKITNKFNYDDALSNIVNINLLADEINPTSISTIECEGTLHNEILEKINKLIKSRINAIKSLKDLLELEITENERQKILELIVILESENKKSKEINDYYLNQNKVINCINTALQEFKNKSFEINSSDDNKYTRYVNNVNSFSMMISNAVKWKNLIEDFSYNIDEFEIIPNEKHYLNYIFIKKTRISKVDNHYIERLLNFPFKKGKTLPSIKDLNKQSFVDMLNKYDDEKYPNPVDFYKTKLVEEIEKDFKNDSSIIQNEDNLRKEYSDGVNAHVYFDIISSNHYEKGIYLIDQPEDDVSPSSIKKYLLKNFKSMAKDRQILLITHNPQFVVNLDVDNVICITKNDKKQIEIINGALEYKDEKIDIIKTVADTLDGGIDSIRKRWKRYEKDYNN